MLVKFDLRRGMDGHIKSNRKKKIRIEESNKDLMQKLPNLLLNCVGLCVRANKIVWRRWLKWHKIFAFEMRMEKMIIYRFRFMNANIILFIDAILKNVKWTNTIFLHAIITIPRHLFFAFCNVIPIIFMGLVYFINLTIGIWFVQSLDMWRHYGVLKDGHGLIKWQTNVEEMQK